MTPRACQRSCASTSTRSAANLLLWPDFLHRQQSVSTAEEADDRAFEAHLRFPADGSEGIAGATWNTVKSAVKTFHEWLRDKSEVPLPFTLEIAWHPRLGKVTSIRNAGRVTKSPHRPFRCSGST